MPKYIVNATTGEFNRGEVVDIDPALFADEIDAQVLSPIDDEGNRLTPDGGILILSSTTEEQRREREATIEHPFVPNPESSAIQ